MRSQPNPEARVITEIFAWDSEEGHSHMPIAAYDYFGEWTSPQGSEWVMIKYVQYAEDDMEEDIDAIGFVPKKDARFVTNAQVKKVAEVVEVLETAAEASIAEKQEIKAQYQQQTQRQKQTRQIQQAQQQVYQCIKCGKRVTTQSANNLPDSPCYNEQGKLSLLGTHTWNRLQ